VLIPSLIAWPNASRSTFHSDAFSTVRSPSGDCESSRYSSLVVILPSIRALPVAVDHPRPTGHTAPTRHPLLKPTQPPTANSKRRKKLDDASKPEPVAP
jgi:hypothetical protein